MNFVIISLALVVIILASYVYKSSKYKLDIAKHVVHILLVGIFTCITVILEGFCKTKMMSLIAYGIYFAATDWLMYFVVHFSIAYIGKNPDTYMKKWFWIPILTLDTAFVCSNVWHEKAFYVVETEFNGLTNLKFVPGPYFWVHMCPIYVLIVVTLFTLLVKALLVPQMFRKKYLPLFVIVAAIVATNAYCMFFGDGLDISVYGYAFGSICIHYFALSYIPTELLNRTLAMVAADTKEGLIIFDDTKCIYVNKSAKTILFMGTDDVEEEKTILQDDFDLHHLDRYEDIDYNKTFMQNGSKSHIQVHFKKITDAQGRYLGSFFNLLDITNAVSELEREQYKATHDELTGLFNREYFYTRAEQLIRENADTEYLLLCSDIGRFKLVNDLFGQNTGDRILKRFADTLRSMATPLEVYGRLGDDHFALMMPKSRYNEDMFLDVPKELTAIADDVDFPLVTYVGVYEVTNRIMPVSAMCDRALMAILSIKGDFTKRVAYYNEGMRQAVLQEQELLGEMENALEKEELTIFLQAQVDSAGNVLGGEALARWIHPKKGFISPGDFIPVFERNGVIAKMDVHMWKIACRQLKKWKEEGKEKYYISVNLSPNDFYFVDIYEMFTGLVKEYDIDPKNLKLEITETAVMGDTEKLLELIDRLHEAGFVVEMDDFGSGYSSLNMLKDLNVDVIKMDMRFLQKTENVERSRTILEFMINLSKKLGMDVISEGVETADQVAFLKKTGCEVFQGYYFSKPLSLNDFDAMLDK